MGSWGDYDAARIRQRGRVSKDKATRMRQRAWGSASTAQACKDGAVSLIDHDAVDDEGRFTRIDAKREWKYEEQGSVSA